MVVVMKPNTAKEDIAKLAAELEQLGAVLIGCDALTALDQLRSNMMNFIDQ